MSDFLDHLCSRVETAARNGTPLRPVGGNTKQFYGGPLQGEDVNLSEWTGILAYEPTELVITAKAGTPLATIEAALAEHQQELAFEPPRFGAQSTIGGVIASGLAGPARLARGGVKDYVLGCTLLDGKGQLLHFGGVVMKNVAGYDVSRVIPGSLGTLGIAVDLSIKVLPKAVAEATLQFEYSEAKAIEQTNGWLGKPLPINATAWENGLLTVRLRGARAAVDAAVKGLGGAVMLPPAADAFWASLRDQTHPMFTAEGDLWRLAVPATRAPLNLPGQSLHEWASGLRWLRPAEGTSLEHIRSAAQAVGGHSTLYRSSNPEQRAQAFHAPAKAMVELQRRLKQQFDPAGIFSVNRLAPIL
ncbi:MAG TPA: glycolate oxidase subunit GlcE [Limnobacter sp.]|uniref:glycolate oxidase subunit GlcE n=1 Tax=Limnobacter sp. TaxID=2003368 RepID=UPI002ED7C552